jgi:hypothetical protein
MPVPSYNVITDAETAIGKPVTSSLIRRLRDNACALFGIDPTNPTPAATIPLSYFKKDTFVNLNETKTGGNGSPGAATTAIVVGDSSLSGYDFRIGSPVVKGANSDMIRQLAVGDVDITAGSPTGWAEYVFQFLGVEWGGTDYVRVCMKRTHNQLSYGMAATIDVAVQVGAGWTDLSTTRSGNDKLQAQAVASGSTITLQFRSYRVDNPSNNMSVVVDLSAIAQHFHSVF